MIGEPLAVPLAPYASQILNKLFIKQIMEHLRIDDHRPLFGNAIILIFFATDLHDMLKIVSEFSYQKFGRVTFGI
jgi:hypothetical protein